MATQAPLATRRDLITAREDLVLGHSHRLDGTFVSVRIYIVSMPQS